MALNDDIGNNAKKLLVPAAASLAGAGAGLALTRKSVRKAMPDLGDRGIGDIADDLKSKLDSVIGRAQSTTHIGGGSDKATRHIDSRELHQRLREREERRKRRRARS